ncbi:hypothetical protein CAPTEDRAFT_191637 [Capitella teleta]|uniref:C-type lectin domain-containing protein n=1 Tax=Capitella teleta TaxID=283909 RepID=R7T401_CAPTE|nr:hypothetical protein CAPTEDRAFT_191637 [Capitella teleta]|eukprot:ELT87528.1 hypothetical protein CAPTEDRAFT_191637 [Capitella teleta]
MSFAVNLPYGGWHQNGDTCYKALLVFSTTRIQAESMCRWYSASLASITNGSTYDFLVKYVDGLQPEHNDGLPEGHPVAELWWTSGSRRGDDWYWGKRPSDEVMKDSPWLQLDSQYCRKCYFPLMEAKESTAVVLANFDGEYGFANVPDTNEYDFPYPLCEKPCVNLLGD